MVLEKTLESPFDSKEIKPVNPKGNQPRISIVRTDTEAEARILSPPDVRAHSLEMILMLREIEGKRKRRTAKDESITDSIDMSLSKL